MITTAFRKSPISWAFPAGDIESGFFNRVENTANGPALCPGERWRLSHTPLVLAGSSVGSDCTGKKGQHLMHGVQQAADPAIGRHRGVSPRSPEGTRDTCLVQQELEEVLQESVQRSRYVVKGGKTWTRGQCRHPTKGTG